jgi:thiol-disulfide isomerase/thioredoxin
MKRLAPLLLIAVVLLMLLHVTGMPTRPSLKVTTLDGKPYDLASQRGNWVVVNIWATWCAACVQELPDLSQFASTHPEVSTIGIAYDDTDPAAIRAFLEKHPVSYPVARVPMEEPLGDFTRPRFIPTTWVIEPNGKVAKHFVGEVTPAALSAVIGE